MGFRRSIISPVGGNRHGVIRMSNFFKDKTGSGNGELSERDWFYVPEQSLAEAVNGKIFRDDLGQFSAIRERLAFMPENVRLKKIAGNLLIMGQSGQYNYPRCIARGDTAAAQLSLVEFVKSSMNVIFLLNRRYMTYYKWSFRALSELEKLSSLYSSLEFLISSGNTETEAFRKQELTAQICEAVVKELREGGLSEFNSNEMEAHAYSVNDRITDGELRNLHILYAI